jgi:hypothetical protein
MPPAPPRRDNPGDYHFHAYDYPGAVTPFARSAAQPNRANCEFYSLVQDLAGLEAEGNRHQVPNMTRYPLPGPGTAAYGRQLLVLSFGNLGNVPGRPTVLITGGIHAREWAAVEMVYLLAEYLIINYNPVPAGPYQAALKNLVDTRNIRIIPMVNPDGNETSMFTVPAGVTGWLWRKNRRPLPGSNVAMIAELTNGAGVANPPFQNVGPPPAGAGPLAGAYYDVPDYDPAHGVPPSPVRRYRRQLAAAGWTGVDLNRNFATMAWGYDCAPNYVNYSPVTDSYFGPRRGSEIETALMQAYLGAFADLGATIDYHSYGEFILYPGEAFERNEVRSDARKLGRKLRRLITAPHAAPYQLGAPLGLVQYDGSGTTADYLAEHNAARAFTIEVDPPYATTPNDGSGFKLNENQIMGVFEKNIRGALTAIAAPPLAANSAQRANARQAMTAAAATFLGWDVTGHGNQLPT